MPLNQAAGEAHERRAFPRPPRQRPLSRRDPAERSHRYVGQVLVEERRQGETVWTLADAAEALRQTQQGFAELLGVRVGTLRGGEQGRRQPRGPARRLLQVAARHPMAVLEAVAAA